MRRDGGRVPFGLSSPLDLEPAEEVELFSAIGLSGCVYQGGFTDGFCERANRRRRACLRFTTG